MKYLLVLVITTLLSVNAFSRELDPEKTVDINKVISNEPMNILWLVVEDMSPIISAYGDDTAHTPNINALAKDGVIFDNVYSTSGVCSPSRAALALGMYPSSIGANHMRTTSHTDVTGLPKYEAIPPHDAKMLSQLMREGGYYTTNNLKTDYQFKSPKAAWNESGPYAHWRNRADGQPFFAVVNFTTTHESGLFEPYGIRKIESRHYFADDKQRISQLPNHHSVKTSEAETPVHISPNTRFTIPPYLPDTPVVQRDMWKMYNNLIETDKQIGAVLQQLKDDGLYDNTIIVFYSDHGGPLPRQKRLIYDSGLKVPMIIRFPNGLYAGEKDEQLISFIDFAPTTLTLAGLPVPQNMHGQDFMVNLATKNTDKERQFIHAAADRFDGFTDTIRAVKDKRFKYIRNYRPDQPYYLPVDYREKIPTMQELIRLHKSGDLNAAQAQWFRTSKPPEELFDTQNDPHELNNLVNNKKYREVLIKLRNENERWLASIGDNPNLNEEKLVKQLWNDNDKQPSTGIPTVSLANDKVRFSSDTDGATISYKTIINGKESDVWHLYQVPIVHSNNNGYRVVAHRIGYKASEKVFTSQSAELQAANVDSQQPPNILLILSDDHAWNDYSFMGHEIVQTPAIDKLAAQGVTFTRAYVPTSLCRPSLATIATGYYAFQHGITGNDPSRELPGGKGGEAYEKQRAEIIAKIDQVKTLPQLLKAKGYQSLQTGKWWEGNFKRGGFDQGMTRGFPQKGGRHGDAGLKIGREGLSTITDFIDETDAQGKPFFVWYAPYMPHAPHNPPMRILSKYKDLGLPISIAKYYAMIEWFDETNATLFDYLEEKELMDNTLIIYVSDNGWVSNPTQTNHFLPRSKQSPGESGVRTPIMFSLPSQLPAEMRTDLVSSIDIVPTILGAVGLEIPSDLPGENLFNNMREQTAINRDTIFGEGFAHDMDDLDDPETTLLYRWVIKGEWKLILSYDGKNVSYQKYHKDVLSGPRLYNLINDKHETTNLAEQHPELVESLSNELTQWYPVKKRKILR